MLRRRVIRRNPAKNMEQKELQEKEMFKSELLKFDEKTFDFGSETLIVGSGLMVNLFELGNVIDSFGKVIRFSGFEKKIDSFSGKKVDEIVINTSLEAYNRVKNGKVDLSKRYYVTFCKNNRNERIVQKRLSLYEEVFSNIGFLEIDTKKVGLDFDITNATSGFSLIYHHVQQGNKVFIHGFDFFSKLRDQKSYKHYYDIKTNSAKIGFHHDIKKEGEIIQKWINEGKVINLVDYIQTKHKKTSCVQAFIPIRSGSKGIPHKNIKNFCGVPLTQRVIDAANNSTHIKKTIISTDTEEYVNLLTGCESFNRSKETSTDEASSEMALIEFCKEQNPEDLIVFIQATSPLLKTEEINKGIEMVLTKKFDSAVSVVRQKRFLWSENGIPSYDLLNRPRRQDWDGHFVENGAFYISRVKDILNSGCRVSGRIGLVECSEKSYYEIDEPNDWEIVESIANSQKNEKRPWGKFEVLLEGKNYKVKRITVLPGKRLSYQYHNHRSEVWTIVSGVCKVNLEGEEHCLNAGENIKIEVGQKHRAEALGSEPCVFIEVQTGDYLGEDDIIRIEDDFKR